MSEQAAMQRTPTRDRPAPGYEPALRPYLVAETADDTEFVVVAVDLATARAVVRHRRTAKRLPPGIPAIAPLRSSL